MGDKVLLCGAGSYVQYLVIICGGGECERIYLDKIAYHVLPLMTTSQ